MHTFSIYTIVRRVMNIQTHVIYNVREVNVLGGRPSIFATGNLTIFNIIHWAAGSIVSSTKRLMVQALFDRLEIKQWVAGWDSGHSKILKLYKKTKKNWKDFLQIIPQDIMKKVTLGTSDIWSMSQNRPINPAIHCMILKIVGFLLFLKFKNSSNLHLP